MANKSSNQVRYTIYRDIYDSNYCYINDNELLVYYHTNYWEEIVIVNKRGIIEDEIKCISFNRDEFLILCYFVDRRI